MELLLLAESEVEIVLLIPVVEVERTIPPPGRSTALVAKKSRLVLRVFQLQKTVFAVLQKRPRWSVQARPHYPTLVQHYPTFVLDSAPDYATLRSDCGQEHSCQSVFAAPGASGSIIGLSHGTIGPSTALAARTNTNHPHLSKYRRLQPRFQAFDVYSRNALLFSLLNLSFAMFIYSVSRGVFINKLSTFCVVPVVMLCGGLCCGLLGLDLFVGQRSMRLVLGLVVGLYVCVGGAVYVEAECSREKERVTSGASHKAVMNKTAGKTSLGGYGTAAADYGTVASSTTSTANGVSRWKSSPPGGASIQRVSLLNKLFLWAGGHPQRLEDAHAAAVVRTMCRVPKLPDVLVVLSAGLICYLTFLFAATNRPAGSLRLLCCKQSETLAKSSMIQMRIDS